MSGTGNHSRGRVALRRAEAGTAFPMGAVAAAALLSVALRARFVATPMTPDEGGYLAVARAWASGKELYVETWVDRPQGLLLLFRTWDRLTGGSTAAVRVLAILFGCVAVVGAAYVAHAIAGRRAAVLAAVLVAVASAAARIEGFIANGELLSGALVVAGLAAASVNLFRGGDRRWLLASGLLAGAAVSVKQSGFDGFLAVLGCLLAAGVLRERSWRTVAVDAATCVAGVALVVALLVVHGAVVGLDAWWYAVAGYRLEGRSALANANWHRLTVTWQAARATILPLALVVLAGLVVGAVRRPRVTTAHALLAGWSCFAVLAFLSGGQFHLHYWVILTLPLATVAGVVLAGLDARLAVLAAALVVLPSTVSTARVVVLDRLDVALQANALGRATADEAVARWYEQRRSPQSTLYALCASAELYAITDTIPPYPYLWFDNVRAARGAQDRLVELVRGPDPPTYVVRFQSERACNPTGEVEAALATRYREVAAVAGTVILELREPTAGGA